VGADDGRAAWAIQLESVETLMPWDESQPDWILLTGKPLPVQTAIEGACADDVGGVDIFLGTTRWEDNDQGQDLLALDYEAYPEMAVKQMHDLARRAREQWPIKRLAILHRVGRVEIAQPSVAIVVSCGHRAEAFEACRWIIDSLKKDVAIWKKEVWADGSGTWVHPD
jgi:molybdopterin synthase catalytic subunit